MAFDFTSLLSEFFHFFLVCINCLPFLHQKKLHAKLLFLFCEIVCISIFHKGKEHHECYNLDIACMHFLASQKLAQDHSNCYAKSQFYGFDSNNGVNLS